MQQIKNTVFTPASVGTKESSQALKTGTTTIGMICKDCIVLAADRRGTAGNQIMDKTIEKVKPVTDSIMVTTAGGVADLQLLYKYLQAELRVKKLRTGRDVKVKEAANLLSSWVYNLIRSSGGIVHFLVGGYDTQPQLFDVFPDGSTIEHTDYVTSGSGSVYALGVLESQYKKNMTKEEGIQLMLKAINAALARDSASGNGVTIYIIDKAGIHKAMDKLITTTLDS